MTARTIDEAAYYAEAGLVPSDFAQSQVLAFGWDSAFIPDPVPLKIGGQRMSYAGVYLGGSSAYRVTPPDERRRIADAGLPAMPIWVPTPGLDNPRQQALAAVAELLEAGVPAWATPWRVLMWDLETGIEPAPAYLTTAANTLMAYGYGSLVYASLDLPSGAPLITAYPARTGYVVADYDQRAMLTGMPAHTVGKQYQAGVSVPGGRVDLDVIAASLLAHLGPVS